MRMPSSRVSIDAHLLRELYVAHGLTTEQIAARVGCASRTVLRRLRREGIRTRRRGPAPTRSAPRWNAFASWSPHSSTASSLRPPYVRFEREPGHLVSCDSYHGAKDQRYVYERLYVSLVSASYPFLERIRHSVSRLIGVAGVVHIRRRAGCRPTGDLRYAKAGSIRLLRWMYDTPAVPCLSRKRARAEKFVEPLGAASSRSVGRPRVGWLYNTGAPGSTPEEYLGRGGGTGDSRRSKRRARKGVRVQIPPPVPHRQATLDIPLP
jgi:hypothetical protein